VNSAGPDADGRLRAIARVVRNLHMMHLFEDANMRLNGHLLPRIKAEPERAGRP
jgi:hypothetical protein